MSRHRRGRITVQSQPTGATRAAMRGIGLVHASMGFVFVVVAITEIIPNAGLFGLPFLLGGGFFFLNGLRMVVGKNDLAHRMGYDIESDVQEETIVGLMDDVDQARPHRARPEPDGEAPVGLDVRGRLEQLKTLKNAGLITDQEYEHKRQEILKDL